jgi:MFS family permease
MSATEKDAAAHDVASPAQSTDMPLDGEVPPRPAGWKYKGIKVVNYETWYASPIVQLVLVALVCFLCPGMYNALSGMGGSGLSDPKTADNANTALYSTFAVVAFFAGTFTNRLGIRVSLSLGGLGYCIYVASFLCYKHTSNAGFAIFAGALLGVCAGLLWSAQGAIMMSYPPERLKGRYIAVFWMIFNLGGVIGSLVS